MRKNTKIRVVISEIESAPVGFESVITEVDTSNETAWILDKNDNPQWFYFDELEEIKEEKA